MRISYVVKVWISTIIAAPFIWRFANAIATEKQIDGFEIADSIAFECFAVLFGFFFSLPTFLISYFIFIFLIKKVTNSLLLKSLILLIGTIFTFITFYVVSGWFSEFRLENDAFTLSFILRV